MEGYIPTNVRSVIVNTRRTPKSAKLVGEVLNMKYHRNGVSGRGFWAIIFVGHDDADELVRGYKFIATLAPGYDDDFDEEGAVEAFTSVLRMDDLNLDNAEQAWRGDRFQGELEALLKTYVWQHDRAEGVKYDGAGREIIEMTNRREAIRSQKEKKASSL